MIVEPVTLMPDALVGDALELMARYRVSGVPITDASGVLVGILTNRDLRFGADPAHTVASVMTSSDLVTAPLGTTLSEAQAILGPPQDREAPSRRQRRQAPRADHGQGHREAGPVSARDEGRAWTPPRRRCDRRRPRRARSRCGARRCRRGRDRRRHGARALARGAGGRARGQGRLRHRGDRGQHLDRCCGRGAHRRWGRCVEGRPRSRIDLYNEGRRRRRRAAGDGDLRLRAGGRGRRGAGHRRRRHHVVGRRRQGDRQPAPPRSWSGRCSREPTRRPARSSSCRASASRSTGRWARLAPCAPARSRRIATSRAMSRTPRSSSPRESKRASRTRGRWRRSSTSSSAACVRRWATAVRQRSRRCTRPSSCG